MSIVVGCMMYMDIAHVQTALGHKKAKCLKKLGDLECPDPLLPFAHRCRRASSDFHYHGNI